MKKCNVFAAFFVFIVAGMLFFSCGGINIFQAEITLLYPSDLNSPTV